MDRKNTIINGGVTADGIGAIGYRVAKRLGFETAGIVSSKALDDRANLKVADGIDKVFFVKDDSWGGKKEDGSLSATSNAWVRNSDRYIGVGGGAVAKDEMEAMIKSGKRVNYVGADSNRAKLIAKNAKKGLAAPTEADFRGAAQGTYEVRRAAVLAKRAQRNAEREAARQREAAARRQNEQTNKVAGDLWNRRPKSATMSGAYQAAFQRRIDPKVMRFWVL